MEKVQVSGQLSRRDLQALLQRGNMLFVIASDIDLKQAVVKAVQSSVFLFQGGSLNNGHIKGFFKFKADNDAIFGESLDFAEGTLLDVASLRPEWFGAVGNYNALTHEGHDDTLAINRAIAVAELLSIKKIEFSSCNYFSSGIKINRGNIWLQGCGAQLREDQWKRGKTDMDIAGVDNNRAGIIYCKRGSSCIVCGEDMADPFYMSDLQLVCDKEAPSNGKTAIGIDFRASVNAPAWPVAFERCYFRGFGKAFFMNSTLAYPVDYLKFFECAFLDNDYCLYAGATSKDYQKQYAMARQCTWALEFVNNRCHHNGIIIYACIQKGMCRIENNNCEGTSGVSGNGVGQYAIDLLAGQRANVIVSHNHFEQNSTQLVSVASTDGVDSKVTVTHNNIDGTRIGFDCCRFEKVVLSTDMNADIKDCLVESDFLTTRRYLLAGNASAFLAHTGKRPLSVGNGRVVECTRVDGSPETFVNTPSGRKCMSMYYVHSYSTSTVIAQSVKYDSDHLFLNIEIPYYRMSSNVLFSHIYLRVSYMNGDKVLSASDMNPQYMYSNRNGCYRLRLQACLDKVDRCTAVYVHMAVYADADNLGMDGILYLGRRALLLTAERLDLNCNLLEKYDTVISGGKNDMFILSEGDRFVSGRFDITCIEGGCRLPASDFYIDENDSCVITAAKPIGSQWTDGKVIFRLLETVKTERPDYTKMKYRIDVPLSMVSNGSKYESKAPLLLGRGSGTKEDLSSDIVKHLCPGSVFFDTGKDASYVLDKSGQWKKSSRK